MNTLLNKLLVGIHNVNTTTALSQIHIGHSIADFVMINGEGQVYEIKSGLDNFDHLYDQLHDYFCAFSKVSVLASIHELEKVKKILEQSPKIMRKDQRSRKCVAAQSSLTSLSPPAPSALSRIPCPRVLFSHYFWEPL